SDRAVRSQVRPLRRPDPLGLAAAQHRAQPVRVQGRAADRERVDAGLRERRAADPRLSERPPVMALKKMHLKIELADGTEHQVTIANPALVAWDPTRATRKWPDSESAPMFWMTFLAWHAMSVVAKK